MSKAREIFGVKSAKDIFSGKTDRRGMILNRSAHRMRKLKQPWLPKKHEKNIRAKYCWHLKEYGFFGTPEEYWEMVEPERPPLRDLSDREIARLEEKWT